MLWREAAKIHISVLEICQILFRLRSILTCLSRRWGRRKETMWGAAEENTSIPSSSLHIDHVFQPLKNYHGPSGHFQRWINDFPKFLSLAVLVLRTKSNVFLYGTKSSPVQSSFFPLLLLPFLTIWETCNSLGLLTLVPGESSGLIWSKIYLFIFLVVYAIHNTLLNSNESISIFCLSIVYYFYIQNCLLGHNRTSRDV